MVWQDNLFILNLALFAGARPPAVSPLLLDCLPGGFRAAFTLCQLAAIDPEPESECGIAGVPGHILHGRDRPHLPHRSHLRITLNPEP